MVDNLLHRWNVIAILLVGYFIIVLDISIVVTVLPKIQHALGFSLTSLSWF